MFTEIRFRKRVEAKFLGRIRAHINFFDNDAFFLIQFVGFIRGVQKNIRKNFERSFKFCRGAFNVIARRFFRSERVHLRTDIVERGRYLERAHFFSSLKGRMLDKMRYSVVVFVLKATPRADEDSRADRHHRVHCIYD